MTARRVLVTAVVAVSFVGLFPLSTRLADPLFSRPSNPGIAHPVLVVWPDQIDIRMVEQISDVSPRPEGANYTFNVSPERQAWVEEQVRKMRPPGDDSVWVINIRQLPTGEQEIQLEARGDGISGLIYRACETEIVPLRARSTGPAGAFLMMGVHLGLWGSLWGLIWLFRFTAKRARLSA